MTKIEKLHIIKSYFPDAQAELNYNSPFQLLIAVTLSAQTTDKMVNRVTEKLFALYPDSDSLKNAKFDEIYNIIKTIGLAKTKTKNIIEIAKIYNEDFNDIMPTNRDTLTSLPGVGIKTANVCLANIYDLPYMAVDTHVERVCKRVALVPDKFSVEKVEKTLERLLKDENINAYHHSMIFFGRYHCKAQAPNCKNGECKLKDHCRYYKKHIKNTVSHTR